MFPLALDTSVSKAKDMSNSKSTMSESGLVRKRHHLCFFFNEGLQEKNMIYGVHDPQQPETVLQAFHVLAASLHFFLNLWKEKVK